MAGIMDILNQLSQGFTDVAKPALNIASLGMMGVTDDIVAQKEATKAAYNQPEFLRVANALGLSPEQQKELFVSKNTPSPAAVVNLSDTQESAFRKKIGEQVGARVAAIDENASASFDAMDGINRAVTAVQSGAYNDPIAAQKALITEIAPILGAKVDPAQVAVAANTRELQRFNSMIQLQAQQYMKGNANGKEAQTIKDATNTFGQGDESLANSLAVASLGAKKAQFIQQKVYETIESGAGAEEVARAEALARRETVITPEALTAERERFKQSFQRKAQPAATPAAQGGKLWRRVQ